MKRIKIKKTLDLKRLMMAVAITACIVNHAFAAAPKAESIVSNDRITLADVFDGVESNGDSYLAPAPAPGQSLTLNANDLTRISNAFRLGWTPDNSMERVVIRRVSGEICRREIEAVLQEKLAEKMKGRRFETVLQDSAVSLLVPEGTDKKVNIDNFSYDVVKNIFQATVSAASAPEVKKEVKGRVHPLISIPVLKEPMRSGDIISAHDIDTIDIRMDSLTSSMIVDGKKLAGLTPRRGIAAMKPVTASDVQMPVIVKKGDLVTMALKNGAVSLTAQGRAMDDGVEGEAIRVMNTSSKQVVDAVIANSRTVVVQPPSALAAHTL